MSNVAMADALLGLDTMVGIERIFVLKKNTNAQSVKMSDVDNITIIPGGGGADRAQEGAKEQQHVEMKI